MPRHTFHFVTNPLFCLVVALVFTTTSLHSQSVHIEPCIHNPASATSIPHFTYDVVSIRPHAPGDGSLSIDGTDGNALNGPTFNVTGITLKNLVEIAYGVSSFQVVGGPASLVSQRFDLRARSDDSVGNQFLKLTSCQADLAKQQMLQAVLAERLKLTIHHRHKRSLRLQPRRYETGLQNQRIAATPHTA